MKFTCEKNALVSAISVASRTVAQKSTIPALEGIYIRAGVKLTLSGYNLETGITISVDADIQETGACIMPSRLFFDIIRKLPDDTVSISVDENFKVSIRGGISSFSITAMSSEDYPELLKDCFFLRKRVRDGRDCLIAQPQCLFSAGKFCMELPGLRRKLPQIPRAVGDEDRADLRHAVVELRQRLKQRRPVAMIL